MSRSSSIEGSIAILSRAYSSAPDGPPRSRTVRSRGTPPGAASSVVVRRAVVDAADQEALDLELGALSEQAGATDEARREQVAGPEVDQPAARGRQPGVHQREQRHPAVELARRGELQGTGVVDDRCRLGGGETHIVPPRAPATVDEPAHDAGRPVVGDGDLVLAVALDAREDRRE